jgi:ADP-ribosylglycohydrolase
MERWQRFYEGYTGYKDQASQITYENLKKGMPYDKAGSPSNDLAGAVRAVAIGLVYGDDPEEFVRLSRKQASLTHNSSETLVCAEFFARATSMILNNRAPLDAIKEASKAMEGTLISSWTESALTAKGEAKQVLSSFGLSCHANEALPGVIFMIKELGHDLESALIEAVMAGGDNATRASAVGMFLGAAYGIGAVPERWIKGLKRLDEIRALMDGLERIRLKRAGN